MLFLIDENLPESSGRIFAERGFQVEYVASLPKLQGESDEALFDYAIRRKAIVVTRDIGFASFARFPLFQLEGFILIRFPNEISISGLCEEVARLLVNLKESEFHQLIIVEPGLVRTRSLNAFKEK